MRFLFATCCLVFALGARAETYDIDNAELTKLTAAGVPVIDIRTQPEWQETGILPGSHLLTFFDETGRANPTAWLEKAQQIAAPSAPVILICRTGNRTRVLSQFLARQAGYAKVYNVKSGIVGWMREGRSVTPAASAITACRAAKTC